MAKTETPQTVELKKQLLAERPLFMGKLGDDDKIPGSNVTLKEAREANEKLVADFEKEKADRKARVAAENAARELSPRELENTTQTMVVVPGVLVEAEREPATTEPLTITEDTSGAPEKVVPELTEDAIRKLNHADLKAYAEGRGIGLLDGEKKDELLARVLA